MRKLLIALIKLYQKIPGPWHSACKYYPTCSNYAIESLDIHGFFKGSWLILKRLIKCNPFSKGGFDPVPPKNNFTND